MRIPPKPVYCCFSFSHLFAQYPQSENVQQSYILQRLKLWFHFCFQVSGFFSRPDVDQGSGKLAVQQSLESIAANIKWLERYGGTVYEWLTHPSFKAPQQGTATRHRMQKPKYLSYDEMIEEKYGRP